MIIGDILFNYSNIYIINVWKFILEIVYIIFVSSVNVIYVNSFGVSVYRNSFNLNIIFIVI